MRRIRLMIEYDGTAYVGWQTQPNGIAIQQKMEEALQKITGEQPSIIASGRTDSGVHALAQVAHFDTAARMPAEKFAYAFNALLPPDIRVRYSDAAPPSIAGGTPEAFHARFSAKGKQYRYTVLHAPHARAFLRDTALHVHGNLNFCAMRQAAADIVGTHDFAAFKAANSAVESTVREIFRSEWTQEGELLRYDVEGSGFLYNMVRILVGTMLEIGKGTLPPGAMARALASGARADAGATAPAHGLCLMRVWYDGFDTEHK